VNLGRGEYTTLNFVAVRTAAGLPIDMLATVDLVLIWTGPFKALVRGV